MKYKGFTIDKEHAYVWRVVLWGSSSHHNWIPAWSVRDESKRVVLGGHFQGNNTKSGYANVPRRKDAKAWVDGFRSFHDEPKERRVTVRGEIVHSSTHELRTDGRDEGEQAFFESGYHKAQYNKSEA